MAFVIPFVMYWLEREIARVHHEGSIRWSYISLRRRFEV